MTQGGHNNIELLVVIERRRGINVTSMTRTGSVRESPEKLLIVVEGIGSLSVINMRAGAAEKSKKRLIVIVDARVWSSHTKGRSGRDGDAQLSGDLFVSLVRVIREGRNGTNGRVGVVIMVTGIRDDASSEADGGGSVKVSDGVVRDRRGKKKIALSIGVESRRRRHL
jgi:hypothetical protein